MANLDGVCRLCGEKRRLLESHIIPAFVFRWLRESSPVHMRSARQPNRRIQDGPKPRYFCADCEARMNRWETPFSDRIFRPFHESTPVVGTFPYEEWGIKFVTSVSWRGLLFLLDQPTPNLDDPAREACAQALEEWRSFLLDDEEKLAPPTEQHILVLDVVERASGLSLSPYLNRYFLRGIDLDLPSNGGRTVMVFVKLCRLLILGFVRQPHPDLWRGTRVTSGGALVQPSETAVPQKFLEYLNHKATTLAQTMQQISPAQRAKIGEAVDKNLERLMSSELGRAMYYDLLHNPDTAPGITEPPPEPES